MKKVTSSDFDIVVDALIVPSKTRHSTPSKSNHSMKKVASSQSEEEDVDKMIALSKNNHDTTDTIKSAAMELKVDGDKLKIPKKCLIKDSSDAVEHNTMPKLWNRLQKPSRRVPENTSVLQKFVIKLREKMDANVHDFDLHLFGVKCGKLFNTVLSTGFMGLELNHEITSFYITSNGITSITRLCAAELEVNEDTTSQNVLHTASAAAHKAAFEESFFSQYVPIYEKARISGSP